MSPTLIKALQLIFSLSLLVMAHEFGHLFFSKLFKVRVEKFYLFFNPSFSLFRARKYNGRWHFRFLARNGEMPEDGNTDQLSDDDWRKHPEHTEWGIGWLPLGGYCKIAGMVDESIDKDQLKHEPKPWEYRAVSTWKRLPIITGGVLVNFILAFVLYAAVLFAWGEQYIPMDGFTKGYDFSQTALQYGFKNGDVLCKADGEELGPLDDINLRKILDAKQVSIVRGGKETVINLPEGFGKKIVFSKEMFATPILPFVADSVIASMPADRAGIIKGDSIVAFNGHALNSFMPFADSLKAYAGKEVKIGFMRKGRLHTVTVLTTLEGQVGVYPAMFSSFYKVTDKRYTVLSSVPAGIRLAINKLTGYVSDFKYLFSKEGAQSLGGFASMGSLYSPVWDWQSLWEMTAFLSIILAFMNILPIPALDGGHLLFLLYEMVTGKKPSQKFLIKAQYAGMLLLLALMIFANLNDFFR